MLASIQAASERTEVRIVKNGSNSDAALWVCGECESWWCSQPALAPTDFLQNLPKRVMKRLEWSDFRGWAVGSAEHVAICPECDAVSSAPVYGNAGQAERRQPMFALHAARGMSVRNMRKSGFAPAPGD
jgi:hypothetical protein